MSLTNKSGANESGLSFQILPITVHDSGEFMGQEISVVVHLQFVGVVSQKESGIVLGNPLFVLHEDLHTEFLFLGVGVVFAYKKIVKNFIFAISSERSERVTKS